MFRLYSASSNVQAAHKIPPIQNLAFTSDYAVGVITFPVTFLAVAVTFLCVFQFYLIARCCFHCCGPKSAPSLGWTKISTSIDEDETENLKIKVTELEEIIQGKNTIKINVQNEDITTNDVSERENVAKNVIHEGVKKLDEIRNILVVAADDVDDKIGSAYHESQKIYHKIASIIFFVCLALAFLINIFIFIGGSKLSTATQEGHDTIKSASNLLASILSLFDSLTMELSSLNSFLANSTLIEPYSAIAPTAFSEIQASSNQALKYSKLLSSFFDSVPTSINSGNDYVETASLSYGTYSVDISFVIVSVTIFGMIASYVLRSTVFLSVMISMCMIIIFLTTLLNVGEMSLVHFSADFCMDPSANVIKALPSSIRDITSYYIYCNSSIPSPFQGDFDSAAAQVQFINSTFTLYEYAASSIGAEYRNASTYDSTIASIFIADSAFNDALLYFNTSIVRGTAAYKYEVNNLRSLFISEVASKYNATLSNIRASFKNNVENAYDISTSQLPDNQYLFGSFISSSLTIPSKDVFLNEILLNYDKIIQSSTATSSAVLHDIKDSFDNLLNYTLFEAKMITKNGVQHLNATAFTSAVYSLEVSVKSSVHTGLSKVHEEFVSVKNTIDYLARNFFSAMLSLLSSANKDATCTPVNNIYYQAVDVTWCGDGFDAILYIWLVHIFVAMLLFGAVLASSSFYHWWWLEEELLMEKINEKMASLMVSLSRIAKEIDVEGECGNRKEIDVENDFANTSQGLPSVSTLFEAKESETKSVVVQEKSKSSWGVTDLSAHSEIKIDRI